MEEKEVKPKTTRIKLLDNWTYLNKKYKKGEFTEVSDEILKSITDAKVEFEIVGK